MRRRARFAVVFVLVLLPRIAAGQCYELDLCARVNGDVEVFVAKVMTPIDDDGAIRAHVTMRYKGRVRGDVRIVVAPAGTIGLPEYEIGQSFLFYASRQIDGAGKALFSRTCTGAQPFTMVSRDELDFLEGLKTDGPGQISGFIEGLDEKSAGIRVDAIYRGRRFSTVTDTFGEFLISGVPPGVYELSARGPRDLLLQADTPVRLTAHGCVGATIMARHNATVSGRVRLPAGLAVEGTEVIAFDLQGGEIASTFADKDGIYTIAGIDKGQYVVGINAGPVQPRPSAPYPSTFAPDVTERHLAARIDVETGARLRGVDISVSRLLPIVKVPVTVGTDDGGPMLESSVGIDIEGGADRMAVGLDALHRATLELVTGRHVVVNASARVEGDRIKCASPVPIDPPDYPASIELTLTGAGCTAEWNQQTVSRLMWEKPELYGRLQPMTVVVEYADGKPAGDAEVGIDLASQEYYPGNFITAADGRVLLLAPIHEPFVARAELHRDLSDSRPRCGVSIPPVRRDASGRWRNEAADAEQTSSWHPATEPLVIRLEGTGCGQ